MRWTQRLRIRQLHVLVELHRIRNLSRTAANLDMTQSALSKWLAELEDDLGVPLFEREPKGITPTACCDELTSHARKILAEVDRARATLEHIAQGASGHLAIGAAPATRDGTYLDRPAALLSRLTVRPPGGRIP